MYLQIDLLIQFLIIKVQLLYFYIYILGLDDRRRNNYHRQQRLSYITDIFSSDNVSMFGWFGILHHY